MRSVQAEYPYNSSALTFTHSYLLPTVERIIATRRPERIFDLGCGNGAVANRLSNYASVTGIDISLSGVKIAQRSFPQLNIQVGSVYDDLVKKYGTFPIVVSLEVIEHLYDPRAYSRTLFELVEAGGLAIISTPYHGYWKNLMLSLTGRLDTHFTALWDGGHIKFWSIHTLKVLLEEAGFCHMEFLRVGRIPPLARSMVAIAQKSQ